jgi:hypothetical protein
MGEVKRVHEVDHDDFFDGDGVLEVGPGGSAVAEEVRHVDVEAGGGEGGDHWRPVLAAGAEAVDEDERRSGRAVGWEGFEVMQAVVIDGDGFAADVGAPEVIADLLVVDPERIEVEDGGGDEGQEKESGGDAEEVFHSAGSVCGE